MGSRGRRAGNALAVVPPGTTPADILSFPRAKAPAELTEEQQAEWTAIVAILPAQHFSKENLPLLAQYCRHIVSARKVAQLIAQTEKAKAVDLDEYDKLLKMQERESRCSSSLATRMRFSQQSIYEKDKKRGTISASRKPWETDDEA